MNLTLYFRLILLSIFQKNIVYGRKYAFNDPINYSNTHFMCPQVVANDGWRVSLQIHNGNYCRSENGYREFGHTMTDVEFGFPSEHEELLIPYAEDPDNITNTVGSVPVSVLEEIFKKRGGIDWEATISVETFENFVAKS